MRSGPGWSRLRGISQQASPAEPVEGRGLLSHPVPIRLGAVAKGLIWGRAVEVVVKLRSRAVMVCPVPSVRPGDLPSPVGVTACPDDSEPIGMAFGAGWFGPEGGGPLEAVWRLVVRGEAIEGRFALRGGVFVELVEEA